MKDNEKDAPLHKLFELGPKYFVSETFISKGTSLHIVAIS